MEDLHEEDFMILYSLANKPYKPTFSWSNTKEFTLDNILSPPKKNNQFIPDGEFQKLPLLNPTVPPSS